MRGIRESSTALQQERERGDHRHSRAAQAGVGVAVVLLAVHMFFTAVVNVPSDRVKYDILPGALADRYAEPYLVQDYKIFAPDPADADHQLWVRAWIESENGEREPSEWVNTTHVELSTLSQKVLRKQLSVTGAERLMGAYQRLSEPQQRAAQRNFLESEALYGIDAALRAADDTRPAAVSAFIRADNYAASYATQVAHALWGDRGSVVGVQVRAVYDPVIRWNDRHDPNAQRPAATYTDLGWVPPLEWDGQDPDAFARTFTEWAERDGVAP